MSLDRTAGPPGPPSAAGGSGLHQSELLSALSFALDLTEGQPFGHTMRSCAIGLRLAEELGMGVTERSALYYALLLKDAGCSSNAARIASVFGSGDQEVKYGMKLVDWHRRVRVALSTARQVGEGTSLLSRLRYFVGIARSEELTRELIQIRCDRGAAIVRQLGFPESTAEAVRCLDEHWSGLGYPDGLRGERIPLLSRIALLSQTMEIFFAANGPEAAVRVARERRGSWFDPKLVDLVRGWERDRAWWERLRSPDLGQWLVDAEPTPTPRTMDDTAIDTVAGAFADIIDAKSPYTYCHSRNVADYARGTARAMGFADQEQLVLFRAGLLHDIGKLGISSRILEKNGPLSPEERLEIERHPVYSWQILSRIGAFREFSRVAALHHEKLDGSGYPWKLKAAELTPADRVLCVADIYEALTADRPYRAGLPPERAIGILRSEAGSKLCATSVDGLEAYAASL
jgi:putative nucleotidyltransferase with HDIG domain